MCKRERMETLYAESERVQKGKQIAEQIWWSLAKRILRIAGDLYKWDDNDWREAQEIFLRPNDYFVVVEIPDE